MDINRLKRLRRLAATLWRSWFPATSEVYDDSEHYLSSDHIACWAPLPPLPEQEEWWLLVQLAGTNSARPVLCNDRGFAIFASGRLMEPGSAAAIRIKIGQASLKHEFWFATRMPPEHSRQSREALRPQLFVVAWYRTQKDWKGAYPDALEI